MRVNTQTQAVEWVDLSAVGLPVHGATGICIFNEKTYAVLQVKRQGKFTTVIVEIDQDYAIRRVGLLPKVVDAHSIVRWNGRFLVASTETNQIVAVDWEEGQEPRESIYFDRDPGSDTLHMNSLWVFENRLYVSMFGPKTEVSWRSAINGQVLDITDQPEVMAQALKHPHALFEDNGSLLCLSSASGQVEWIAGKPVSQFPSLSGYIRGATSDRAHFYVGASIARAFSKSRQVKEEADGCAKDALGCGLHIVDKATNELSWIDLGAYGAELYDVAICRSTKPITGTHEEAMKTRLLSANAEASEITSIWARLNVSNRLVVETARTLVEADRHNELAARLLDKLMALEPENPEWQALHAMSRSAVVNP